MVAKLERAALSKVPDPTRSSEPSTATPTGLAVRRLGRVRLPLAGPHRPWATLYRHPDGRTVAVVRLWDVDGPVRRVYPLAVLRSWAARQRLDALVAAIDALSAPIGR